MTRVLVALLLGIFISSNTFAQSSLGLNPASIMRLTGAEGKVNTKEKVFKVFQTREDLKISMSGVQMIPTMGLTSWVAFKKLDKETVIVGNLVLTEDQISPVMSIALNNGIRITSLESHFLWETPKVMFMHIEATGNEKTLAANVGKIFKEITQTSNGNGNFPLITMDVTQTTLNPHKIDSVLHAQGTLKDGVYKVIFEKKVAADSNQIGNDMGGNTWASFAGSDKEAVVVGDIATDQSILDKVLLTLQQSGIYILSIHQQSSHDDPKVVYLHYVGIGSPSKLAKGIRTALNIKIPEVAIDEEKDFPVVNARLNNPNGISEINVEGLLSDTVFPITLIQKQAPEATSAQPSSSQAISTSQTKNKETTTRTAKS